MSMVDSKAAFIIEESELTGEKVIEYADRILGDEETLKEYSQNAGKMAIVDANDRIYSVIRTVLSGVAK